MRLRLADRAQAHSSVGGRWTENLLLLEGVLISELTSGEDNTGRAGDEGMCFQRSSGWIDQLCPRRGLQRSGDGEETQVEEGGTARTDSKTSG